MRLLNTQTLATVEFMDDRKLPEYAILSHTWGDEECSLQDMNDLRQNVKPEIEQREGYRKIQQCCKQALQDDFAWAWVDSCCINKTSTAELSEAINSMFRWYQNASLCYVFLSDARHESDVPKSRWFTRGWTLQELIAPKHMHFFSADWRYLGSKNDLRTLLLEVTGIEESVLLTSRFDHIPVAKRMTWAAGRQTTRAEDRAYSLLGIFDVNMPLLYGEGHKSFKRLQEEIMKVTDDHTLYAWGMPARFDDDRREWWSDYPLENIEPQGLLAESPDDFVPNHDLIPLQDLQSDMPPIVASSGVRIELPVRTIRSRMIAILSCTLQSNHRCYLGVPVVRWGEVFTARSGPMVIVPAHEEWSSSRAKIKGTAEILLIKQPTANIHQSSPTTFTFVRLVEVALKRYILDEVFCLPHAAYSATDRTMTFAIDHWGPHGALIFSPDRTRTEPMTLPPATERLIAFPFAIVVGSSPSVPAWASFVPLLPEDNPDQGFRSMSEEYPEYVKNCMTTRQLKNLLHKPERETRDILIKSTHLEYAIQCWFRTIFDKWEATMRIELEVALANLVEKSIFVYIQIESAKVKGESGKGSAKPSNPALHVRRLAQAVHQKERDLTWRNAGTLPWFSTNT